MKPEQPESQTSSPPKNTEAPTLIETTVVAAVLLIGALGFLLLYWPLVLEMLRQMFHAIRS